MSESRIAPPVRVLLADASEVFKKTAAEALTRKGFAVEIADMAEDAFGKVRTFEPEIVFYDTGFPGYDGFEALTLISKTRAGKECFLIATSEQGGEEVRARSIEAGARAFMRRPVGEDELLETALIIKRHVRRPRTTERKTRHGALKVTLRTCHREGCGSHVAAFALKGEGGAKRKDQFETPIYTAEGADERGIDYNLVCVSVCPACYFATDESQPLKKAPEAPRPRGAAPWLLMKIASEADDTIFTEERTPSAALVAYRLAIENLEADLPGDSPEAINRLADLFFKAASVAHRAGDERLRDRFLGDAEGVSTTALAMAPSAAVYRAAYRLVAAYVFFARDLDAARTFKLFDRFNRPGAGRLKPRDVRILETYRSKAAELVAQKHFYRRANYLARR